MSFAKKDRIVSIAVVVLAVAHVHGAIAGVIPPGGFATEWTQIANKLQLAASYARQGEQLQQEIQMLVDMKKNSAVLPSQVFGRIASDLAQLATIVQGGQALAYSMANLDAEFRSRFRGWGYSSRTWYVDYRNWSQTSLDTTLGTLRAAGLQGQQLESEQAVLDSLRGMAQSSDGRMRALQVANQIAEQQVEQTMKLRQLMLADIQSKQTFQAAQMQRQAASESASEQFFTFGGRSGDGKGYQAGQ
jgi:P-type conjugative transfer protein TrbJ